MARLVTAAEINDLTARSDDEFRAWLARVEATPAAAESAEVVEEVARAMWRVENPLLDYDEYDDDGQDDYRRLAVAAVTALADRHTETEQAVGRCLALADYWDIDEDARYSHNRISRQTAARAVREGSGWRRTAVSGLWIGLCLGVVVLAVPIVMAAFAVGWFDPNERILRRRRRQDRRIRRHLARVRAR